MSDLEKFKKVIEEIEKDRLKDDYAFENIASLFIEKYTKEFSVERLWYFMNGLNTYFMKAKIQANDFYIREAREKASYVDKYLKGEMYKTPEAAQEYLPLQKNNASRVVECLNKYN